MESRFSQFVWLIASFLVVALAQPDWHSIWGIIAASVGYACFWKGMLYRTKTVHRFWLATLWFAAVQAVHLSWMTSDHYVGAYIWVVYLFFLFFLGVQFGLISVLIKDPRKMPLWQIFAIPTLWIFLEWSRLFIFSGFSWNPVGLALTSTLWGMQMTSLFGLFGLSFWVLLTNLFALTLFQRSLLVKRALAWAMVAIFPYVFGYAMVAHHDAQMASSSSLSVVAVQTALSPEQKHPFAGHDREIITPYDQWIRILVLLKKQLGKSVDLIALSESVVPYGTDTPVYSIEGVKAAFRYVFRDERENFYPETSENKVGNAYWAQTLANFFQSDIIIGMEDELGEEYYNAAFLFGPNSKQRERYEKRILLPISEYLPFPSIEKFLKEKFGIAGWFTPGKEAKVFQGKKGGIGVSICYEETFGHMMRENRLRGAHLLVNLSNDAWYPHSRLSKVHYFHGRLRALENGIPLVRSCNTGYTCGLDSLGRVVGEINNEDPAAVHFDLPTYSYQTLYALGGDSLILTLAPASILLTYIVSLLGEKFFFKRESDVVDLL